MEQYEELILEITALAMKANRVTNHHFLVDFSGHVNGIYVNYLENGYKKGIKNRIILLDIYIHADRSDYVLEQIEKCKNSIIALIEGSENSGKLSDSMQS